MAEAIINTIASRNFNLMTLIFFAPEYDPANPPTKAIASIKPMVVSMLIPFIIDPDNPARLLTNMNKADTAAVCFISAQCKSNIKGLKIIPPPMPIIPEKKPMIKPIIKEAIRFCFFLTATDEVLNPINFTTENSSRTASIFL